MGGQKGIALFYGYLSQLCRLHIITTADNDTPPDLKASVSKNLGRSSLRYINFFLFFRIRRILREHNSSHLIIEHPYFGWLGILLKIFTPVKLVVHSHNIEGLRFRSTGKWWWGVLWHYEKLVHRMADINFFISDEDNAYAVKNFRIDKAKCHTITYGFEMNTPPPPDSKSAASNTIRSKHGISPLEKILLFNGTLNYAPNLEAVQMILQYINPILLKRKDFTYKIIICGKGLPPHLNELKDWSTQNIIYPGFVEDINIYFEAADIFINPVVEGGGIKTKLVESLGYNVSGVSTVSGAIGIPAYVTGNKLIVVSDGDWQSFADAIVNCNISEQTPAAFFRHFYWGNIAARAAAILNISGHKTL